MAALKPCAHCHCYISVEDNRCPFCDRVQRTTSAWPVWVLAMSLTGLGACVGSEDPGPKDTIGNSDGPSGPDSIGNDTLDDTDDWGEGATYAGPDPSTSGSWEPATSGTTHIDDDTDDWGEGATYAGPDSWSTGEAATDSGADPDESSTGGSDGSGTGGR